MQPYRPYLDWIASQQDAMLEMALAWSKINSGSFHLEGLARMLEAIEAAFLPLGCEAERLELAPMASVDEKGHAISVPLGKALRFRKHPDAPIKVLFTGHMDTVFPKDHAFQEPVRMDDNTINGPGVTDMKGGIVVMLHALHALEQSPWAGEIGWEVLINSDEEIGSIGSALLLEEGAKRNDFGLTYEPGLPDGTLAGARKGSGNFTAVVRGRAAHAGRNPEEGRNAIAALSEFILAINALNGARDGLTVNPGSIEGGGPTNVVPDLAICRFNSRMHKPEDMQWMETQLQKIVSDINAKDGITLELHGGFTRPPKVLTPANQQLFDLVKACGTQLGLSLQEKPTGGCCDGNNLAAHGLPNVDTLGVRGGAIHSSDEFMIIDSLSERAQLSALLLLRLASKEV
ncbi:MAG: hydrolase, partial [Rickettsiales bacterium]